MHKATGSILRTTLTDKTKQGKYYVFLWRSCCTCLGYIPYKTESTRHRKLLNWCIGLSLLLWEKFLGTWPDDFAKIVLLGLLLPFSLSPSFPMVHCSCGRQEKNKWTDDILFLGSYLKPEDKIVNQSDSNASNQTELESTAWRKWKCGEQK